MLKAVKVSTLRVAETLGLSRLAMESSWRRQKLLILCYHGISLEDEHRWRPALYMEPRLIGRRFELIRDRRCAVLPLSEAISRLYAGELPPRSVAITVDDGNYDFHRLGLPLIRRFGYPVTLYVSTYYTEFNRPVFDPALSYLLWKAGGRRLEWPEVFDSAVTLDAAGRERATRRLAGYARERDLSGRQKDALLAELAGRTGFDYEAMCRKRMFTLMTPEEIRETAEAGVDVQLHTHTHRVYRQKERFLRELDENRIRLEAHTGRAARHFCYPSGSYLPEFIDWLRGWGAKSAVTCVPGLADRGAHPMLLPRLVDVPALSEVEFRCWLSGLATLLPARQRAIDMHSLAG
jgi:peptidoglycan/xylan/chitin deacetylase (PgdA/CDA1 family)